jgi:hypothetical protein
MVSCGPIGILTYVAVAVDGLAWALIVENSLRARLPTNVFLTALQQQSHMGPHIHTVDVIQVQAKWANTSANKYLSAAAIRTMGCCEIVGIDSVRPMQELFQDHTCRSRLLYAYLREQSIHMKSSYEGFTELTQNS